MIEQEIHTKNEEKANAITHSIGIVLSAIALVFLIVHSSNKSPKQIVSISIYSTTLLILYLTSTLYHSLKGKAKNIFRILDHSAIYLLIAGTYTPFTLIVLEGWKGWFLFGLIWTLAIIGILFKVFFTGKFPIVSTFIYITMGWIAIFFIKTIISNTPSKCLYLTLAGGIVYTLGVVFYLFKWFKFHHAIWHIFVLAGSILHFLAILTIL